MGTSRASAAAPGSVTGRPWASVAQSGGSGRPSAAKRRITPLPDVALERSRTTGRPRGHGTAMLHGLVPTSATAPPHGGISGLALVNASPTRPARAAINVKYEAVPKWLLLRAATAPTPVARALAIASVMARCATT